MANFQNLQERINKYDPVEDGKGGHPYSVGGVIRYTQPGIHYLKIVQLQVRLAIDIASYKKDCSDGPQIPCDRMFKLINLKLPEPNMGPTQMTNFEIEMQIESADDARRFWTQVAWAGGAVATVISGGVAGIFEGSIGEGVTGLVSALAH